MISDDYRAICARMHESTTWGHRGYRYVPEFLPYCRELGCREVLDYGCGRNSIRALLEPEMVVRAYDPAIPEFADLPDPADFVVCTDVMEHVEEEHVDAVLAHVHSLARVGAYFNVALTRAKRHLPDGRNAHITIKPVDWWAERMDRLSWRVDRREIGKKTLKVFIRKG